MHFILRSMALLAAAMLLAACAARTEKPSSGAASADSAQPKEELALDDPDRVVCKRIIKTGTRIRTRQCLTLRQWELLQQGSQDSVDEIQRRALHYEDMPGKSGN